MKIWSNDAKYYNSIIQMFGLGKICSFERMSYAWLSHFQLYVEHQIRMISEGSRNTQDWKM